MKLINVCGARPNFMKIAPLMAAYRKWPAIKPLLVHTGQHYDTNMSNLFFDELHIPRPDIDLGIGSGSHAVQTAEIMKAFEPIVLEYRPDAVLVVGDVNSTLACGLVAVKMGVKLAHVEAGLRSFDRTMPEEINRLLTDAMADLLFCTQQSDVDNLLREGVAREKIFLVGNVMIDTLLRNKAKAEGSPILNELGLAPRGYAVLTLHRAANVDDPASLGQILAAVDAVQREMPVIFPVHPRTRKSLSAPPLANKIRQMQDLRLIDPLGYLEFLKLMSVARLVLTDSGGIQTETTILGIPCLTLRENTEWPITVGRGTNQIAGTTTSCILKAYRKALATAGRPPKTPPLWDGHAAERVACILVERLSSDREFAPAPNL